MDNEDTMGNKLGPYLLGPNDENQGIYTGDARILSDAIPDESVDLIFTDPVYQNIDDYRWLAETAVRVLKPDRACLVWSNGKWHKVNTEWLEDNGLTYRWDFGCVISTGPAPMNGKIIAKTNRLIWLDLNGKSRLYDYLADGYWSATWSRSWGEWKWTKNPEFSFQAMRALSTGGVIFDPFCGQGTIPAVCKMLSRRWLAFEIDPATAETARQRVLQTQPPLFTLEPQQAEMMI